MRGGDSDMLTRETLAALVSERVAALVRANLTARNILRAVEWEPEDV